MTPEEIRTLAEPVREANKKHYEWMRGLVLAASGALTVLVSFHSDKDLAGFASHCIKTAWISLGSGILLGSISLHGDVWSAREMARRLAEGLSKQRLGNITVHVELPLRYRLSTMLCYISLAVAVIALVSYAVVRF